MRLGPSPGVAVPERDVRWLARGAVGYPSLLEHLADPPGRLWFVGREPSTLPPCVAIVGTRTPTLYGQEIARALAAELAGAGICIVSGLARGIDACAHDGALGAGTTLAVLAGGADRPYPASNRELYRRITAGGTIVSEVPPGTATHRYRFAVRNRIIAALSLAVVVVQAGERSGALITARHGLDIGREVLAVPGDVRVEVSVGVHELLRDGATPCTCAGDVLARIGEEMRRVEAARLLAPIPATLPPERARILELLGGEAMRAEAIGRAAGLAGSALAVALSNLEIDGWIARGPGGTLRRVR